MNNFMGIWVLEQECIVPIYLNTFWNYIIPIRSTDFSIQEQERWYLKLIRNTHSRAICVQDSLWEKLAKNCEMNFVLHI